MRPSSQIQQEIVQRLGFFPPFFEPALAAPEVLENLWRQTVSAYLENPFSALFKEKLNALLSRYCLIPYCMICHSASLRPLGMTAAEVLELLDSPSSPGEGDDYLGTLSPLINSVMEPDADPASPQPGSRYEQALIACATHLFLKTEEAGLARSALLRLLGLGLYQNFIAYLAYIESCHLWMESHPEISYEADQRVQANLPDLLNAEPALLAFFQDYQLRFSVQQNSRTQGLRRSTGERRFRAAFENAAVGIAIVSLQKRITEANPAYRLLTGYSDAELIGMSTSELIHPEDQLRTDLQIQRLIAGEIANFTAENRIAQKDGAIIYTRSSVSLVRDASGQAVEMMAVAQDITEQHRDAELAAAANQRVSNILESLTDAFCSYDTQWRFSYVNSQSERLLNKSKAELIGQVVWDAFPDLEETPLYAEFRRATAEQAPVVFEMYYKPLDCWFEVHAFPSADGLSAYFHDITDRKEAELARDIAEQEIRTSEERYRLLVEGARDYAMLMADAQGCFTYVNPGAERILGWTGDELMGEHFSMIFTREDQTHEVAIHELERARVGGLSEDNRWHRREDGTLFWAVGVTRSLYDDDGTLRGYAKVVRDATEQKLAQDELDAMHMVTSDLLNSIDDAFYAVDSDWRFTYVNSRAALWFGRSSEQMIGRSLWEMAPYATDDEVFLKLQAAMRDNEVVTFEGISLMRGTWLEISAFPMISGMTIYFRDISERHETQAAQKALLSHEQNIASQLQLALQPEVPEHVPGLAIANYYKAALDEAGVGGDFYDIFSIGPGRTALIVGDLSGKGLAAAAQVAMVRNMLRFVIYNGATLAEGITQLSHTLAVNGLLAGFSTLFVGAYDAAERTLTYVNCAQEPPLVLRAGEKAEVVELMPTGTVLGAFANSEFEQVSIRLEPGDTLAVFTDGLTESGPNRRELLDMEGVTRLFVDAVDAPLRLTPQSDAERIAKRLIEKVDAYAGKGMRDDVCLLVAVVEGE